LLFSSFFDDIQVNIDHGFLTLIFKREILKVVRSLELGAALAGEDLVVDALTYY
jgi:hypothetical protein